ncbi:MAG: LysR substrate-binding domain-containing protein [Burkholderiales bacterium]
MNLLASLRYLVALSEHRHFARAAQACHITQPALSNALRALEKEFGITIVQRSRTYAGLTPEGERVLASAQRMLHEHALLAQDLHSTLARPQGVLRLGVVPTAVPMAARFAALLQAAQPGIKPVLRSMSSPEIEAGLANFSLDIGLGFVERVKKRGSPFAAQVQYSEHYFLLRRKPRAEKRKSHTELASGKLPGKALAFGPATTWQAAAQVPLCLLTPEMHHRSIVDAAFAKAGSPVVPVMETNSILSLVLAVAAGQMSSVLPGSLVAVAQGQALEHGGLQALPLVEPTVSTPMGFITLAQAEPSRVLQAALALVGQAPWRAELARHSGTLTR